MRRIRGQRWTSIFHLEAQAGFTGNGIINSGKGVLEHLALRGEGGTGVYDVYLDDFAVVEQNTLTYSLDSGAPAGAFIPSENWRVQMDASRRTTGNFPITIRVTDRLGLTDFETISVQVIAVGNHSPVLAAIGNKTVNEGNALAFTATATDQDAGQVFYVQFGFRRAFWREHHERGFIHLDAD